MSAPGTDPCLQNDARFFIQYSCRQESDQINQKRRLGLFVACLGIFMCCLFLLTIYYLSSTAYIDYKLWDVSTVTAADFTIEWAIPESIWPKFCKTLDESSDESKSVAFENYIKQEF